MAPLNRLPGFGHGQPCSLGFRRLIYANEAGHYRAPSPSRRSPALVYCRGNAKAVYDGCCAKRARASSGCSINNLAVSL